MCINNPNVLSGTNDAHTGQRMQQEIELQLHEQYAINNNANLGSVVTFMVSIITVVGLYAYTFAHTTLEFSNPPLVEMYDSSCDMYSFDCLFFLAAGVICVLAILQYICLYQGSQQRYEQFIIHAIRCKYFGVKLSSQKPKIFPEGYHPFKKDIESFVQGLYGEFIRIAGVLKCIVVLTSVVKLLFAVSDHFSLLQASVGILILLITVCVTCCCLRCKALERYCVYIPVLRIQGLLRRDNNSAIHK
jgi:hypothetical protein